MSRRQSWRPVALFPIFVLLHICQTPAHTDIAASQAREMILADETVVVVDVREYSEFCGSPSHIEDAVSLPWNSGVLQSRTGELPLDATIIVVCRSGGRSHQAATLLDTQGYTSVHDMLGGMSGWSFETESCDDQSVLTLTKGASGVEINWTPTPGTQDYDLLRGRVEELASGPASVDLGPVECLADDSPFSHRIDPDSPEIGRSEFVLSRQTGATWGGSSSGLERIPVSPVCE